MDGMGDGISGVSTRPALSKASNEAYLENHFIVHEPSPKNDLDDFRYVTYAGSSR